MNRTIRKLVESERGRLITMAVILIVSLIASALLYILMGQGSMAGISYQAVASMSAADVFMRILRRNIVYFAAIICLTCIGQSAIINGMFGLTSVYYGLSVIFLFKIIKTDKLYFLFTFADYFIFFPVLFYFTYISGIIAKYTKKTKKLETVSNKSDIIISGYIKLSVVYLAIVLLYSFGYSWYIIILSKLLVK